MVWTGSKILKSLVSRAESERIGFGRLVQNIKKCLFSLGLRLLDWVQNIDIVGLLGGD